MRQEPQTYAEAVLRVYRPHDYPDVRVGDMGEFQKIPRPERRIGQKPDTPRADIDNRALHRGCEELSRTAEAGDRKTRLLSLRLSGVMPPFFVYVGKVHIFKGAICMPILVDTRCLVTSSRARCQIRIRIPDLKDTVK